MTINHESIPALYATNAKEYNQHKQSYSSTYQPKVRKIIRQVVSQVNTQGSENTFTIDTRAKNNSPRNNLGK